ncbi:uncharacterized protein LOC114537954 [Dendronephthya gigantea]|uniref:uncharacterized protein LOC114537954 n=1 Tax=Dendronephthya gigantea TaxID=151771 RepID=UPI001069E5BD|nr:uncharacterized protein LOC114537954 [Dendronephthya gigantea]
MPQGWNRGTRKEVTPGQIKNFTFRRDKRLRKVTKRDTALDQVVPLFIEDCQLTKNQVSKIEISTRGQNINQTWFEQRKGRVTASKFHQVATKSESLIKKRGKKVNTYSPLVFRLLGKSADLSHHPQIEWGRINKKDAIQAFISDIATQHLRLLSPTTIEIKCPYKVRDKDIFDKNVVKEVDFLESAEGQLRLKCSHEYYSQVQGQMWVCGMQQSYFIVWTSVKKPLYEKILFDAAYCESLVHKQNIMPD